jgi:hypothetical protein
MTYPRRIGSSLTSHQMLPATPGSRFRPVGSHPRRVGSYFPRSPGHPRPVRSHSRHFGSHLTITRKPSEMSAESVATTAKAVNDDSRLGRRSLPSRSRRLTTHARRLTTWLTTIADPPQTSPESPRDDSRPAREDCHPAPHRERSCLPCRSWSEGWLAELEPKFSSRVIPSKLAPPATAFILSDPFLLLPELTLRLTVWIARWVSRKGFVPHRRLCEDSLSQDSNGERRVSSNSQGRR